MALDSTPANAAACHILSKKNGMEHDTFQAILARIDADEWLGKHNIAVGVQELAESAGKWRFENWLKLVRKPNNRKIVRVPTREEDPYSVAALIAEQNPGYFATGD